MRKFTDEQIKALISRGQATGAVDQPEAFQKGDYIIRKQPGGGYRCWIIGSDLSGNGSHPGQAVISANIDAILLNREIQEANRYLDTKPRKNRLQNVTNGFY